MRRVLVPMVACLLLVGGCETAEPSDGTAAESPAPDDEHAAEQEDETANGDASRAESDSEADGDGDGDKIFRGTLVELMDATAECYERRGLEVVRDPDDPTTFTTHPGAHTQERAREIRQQCRDEVGEWNEQSVTEEYTQRVYEHRLWQRDCLIDLGHDLPPAPSFEDFADGVWDPDPEGSFVPLDDIGLRGSELLAAEDECPDLHRWEQQRGLLD